MYRIEAYDIYHKRCWIDRTDLAQCSNGVAFTDTKHEFRRLIDNTRYIRITHPITGERVPVGALQRCGIDTKTGKRIPAYYRIYENDTICYIYITKFGRSKSIRNYQTRHTDSHTASIIGYPIINTGPYIVRDKYSTIYDLIIGEGDPNCRTYAAFGDNDYVDRWGDTVRILAHCARVSLSDTEGSWYGYTFEEFVTRDHYALQRATQHVVRSHLKTIGDEFISKYGSDFTKW